MTTAFGLEEVGTSNAGAALEAARYVLTGSSATATTGDSEVFHASTPMSANGTLTAQPLSPPPTATTLLARTASGGAQTAPNTPQPDDGGRMESATTATSTMRDAARATKSSSLRSKSKSALSSIAGATDESKKPKPRRRTDGETVEDRLLREWILRQARESARMEEIRQAELAATRKANLTGRQIMESVESLRARGEASRKQQEEARKAAEASARRLAMRSVSAHIGKKTRELTAKMPDFSSRQQRFASKAAERAEQRRREAEEEKRAKEMVDVSGERVPMTNRAAQTHRTLEDLQAWNDRREEKIRSAKAKKEQEELHGATFAPVLDQRSLRMALKKRMALNKSREDFATSINHERDADDARHPFTPRLVSRQRETPRDVVLERLYSASKSTQKKSATPDRTPREHWGGYGVDDDHPDADAGASGFISLAELDRE